MECSQCEDQVPSVVMTVQSSASTSVWACQGDHRLDRQAEARDQLRALAPLAST